MLREGWKIQAELVLAKSSLFERFCDRQERLDNDALVLIHGLGEHLGRYLHFLNYLDASVGGVFSWDHLGHGRSLGKRGSGTFEHHVEVTASCIREFHAFLNRKWGSCRLHIVGQSMGGLIALRLPRDLPIASMTVSAPFLGLKETPSFWKKSLGYALSWIAPGISLKSELDPAKLSHDVEVVEAYRKDPWVHTSITPRLFFSMLEGIDLAFQNTGYPFPVQMLVPLEDAIVDPSCSLRFFEMLQAPSKRLRTYPHFYHEPFQELGKQQVFEDLNTWILQCAVKKL